MLFWNPNFVEGVVKEFPSVDLLAEL